MEQDTTFDKIFQWIKFELLKTVQEKRKGMLNKSLVISGESGVGKTTFLKMIIHPMFHCGPLFLDS